VTKAVQDLMVEVERVRDAFHTAVFASRDADAARALLAGDASLVNTPAGTGGSTADEVHRFLADHVVSHLPADLAFRRVSRTTDRWRAVEESAVSFTHDRELPWLLPGVAATGRAVEVLAVSVVAVRRSLVTSHRTLWDHHSLLAQLGVTGRAWPAFPPPAHPASASASASAPVHAAPASSS